MGIYVLDRAVFRYKFPCTDLAHTFDSGHIVRGIPADGQHVYHLFRPFYAVFLANGLFVYQFALSAGLSGLVLNDMVGNQLSVIFVRGDHVDGKPFPFAFFCRRAYHIIRLVSGNHQYRDFQRLADFRQRLEGIYHKLRRFISRRLVLRIDFIPERTSRRIECHGNMGRPLPLYHFQDVFGKSEQNGCVHSFRIYHGPSEKSIIHLENQRVPVYEIYVFFHLFDDKKLSESCINLY